ncbi:MAG: dUTP diphosphatase [Simkania negevensis]|nr:dUTP diphosphatase [Simkania negevensis]
MKKERIVVVKEEKALLPYYASEEAAGADLHAFLDKDVFVAPGERALIPTGLRFEVPKGFEIQIRPRSGLALQQGITVLNTPGTIDSDYRGEIKVLLINHGKESFRVTPNMRIAQAVLSPVYQAVFVEEKVLAISARGEGGFGHTGTH